MNRATCAANAGVQTLQTDVGHFSLHVSTAARKFKWTKYTLFRVNKTP